MEGWEGTRRRLAVLVMTAALQAVGCGASDDSSTVQPVAERGVASAFSPRIWLHSSEEWFPMDAKDFIDHASLKLASDPCRSTEYLAFGASNRADRTVPVTDPTRLGKPPGYRGQLLDEKCQPRSPSYSTVQHTRPFDTDRPPGLAPAEGIFMDLVTASYDGDPRFSRDGRQKTMVDVPLYYATDDAEVGGRPGLTVTYWMLYGASRTYRRGDPRPNKHEGDWERIQVVLRRLGARDRYRPVAVRLYEGDRRREIPWDEIEVVGRGTHPVVYSARFSHLPYDEPGTHERREGTGESSFVVEEETEGDCEDCVRIDSWQLLRELEDQPWYGYGGGWGLSFRVEETTGPLGPSPYRR